MPIAHMETAAAPAHDEQRENVGARVLKIHGASVATLTYSA